jgi:hypothetical protein
VSPIAQFYYPGDLDFPLPPPALMLHMNPITVWLDVLTVVWLNAFVLNLQKSVESLQVFTRFQHALAKLILWLFCILSNNLLMEV